MVDQGTRAEQTRKVVAQVNVSIDGFTAGPNGDMAWLVEHAIHDQMASYAEGIWRGASTVLLGRTNYEGFYGFWPSVATNPDSAPRDRDLAAWLDDVEKVVFSRTLRHAAWRNARVAERDLESEVRALKHAPGRDILVLNSASIIRALLAAGLIDELRINLLPEVLGAGLRLFEDGLPRQSWQLVGSTTLATGAVGLSYRPSS